MATFSKIYGIAGAAIVFAGMAFGQGPATCAAPTATTNIIRAEGTTEQVAQLQIVCTAPAGGNTAGSANLQVFLSPALPITSKVLDSSTGKTEAIVTVNGGAQVNGVVSGSTINFSNITLPVLAAGATYTVVVSNVRVNASSLMVGSGVPPTISETAFISGSAGTLVPAALASTQVAFAQNGLGATKLNQKFTTTAASFPSGTASSGGVNSFVTCNGYSPKGDAKDLTTALTIGGGSSSLAFVAQVNENFASAFKAVGAAQNTGEQSQVTTTLVANTVNDGTRIALNFTNVPSGVTLYVPNGVILSTAAAAIPANTAQIQLTNSAAGTAFGTVTGSGATSITTGTGLTGANGLAAVAISGGSGTATFEVTKDDPNNLDSYNIPVFVVTSANAVAGSATPISVSTSFSPVGSTAIPNFVVGSSTSTVTASTFSTCSTSLLFPFVTNQLGFDTGIAIANTSTDPFGSSGATAQAGTCTLNFYGAGAPSPANVTSANIPSGTVYTQVLSGVAAGFQGYIIAQCQFQYAHGFAFITDGVGANGGLSQGYLAGVIPDTNQVARGANPIGSITVKGQGETLGN